MPTRLLLLSLCLSLLLDTTTAHAATSPPISDEAIAAYVPRHGRTRPVIAVLGENRMTELVDFVVPYGILKRADIAEVLAVAPDPGTIKMLPALSVAADISTAEFDARHPQGADYLIVAATHHNDDARLLAWIRAQAGKGATLLGICDGVFSLAHAGLLNGRRATGHWYSANNRQAQFPKTQWLEQRRYVVDGPIISSSGVSAAMPVSLALVEAIAGRTRAQQLADELGLADWSATHDSRAFTLQRADYLTLAGNWLAFWGHETLIIPVQAGIDEIALALTADAHARTYRSQVLSSATAPLLTRSGLRLIPDRVHGEPGMHSLSIGKGPASHALHQALADIANRHGAATARLVALQLEYPSPYLASVTAP
ncbi:DJ-1/PfpI family protein [Pseudomonas sp. EA_35y_Pfl2_R5]|uniref:DJ-1/PfpI family protein n=1 Tax=Pseudomonas sp. EA_35y_Pfl2_R5 TaxID=3088690 RepID=UPI0030D916FB